MTELGSGTLFVSFPDICVVRQHVCHATGDDTETYVRKDTVYRPNEMALFTDVCSLRECWKKFLTNSE